MLAGERKKRPFTVLKIAQKNVAQCLGICNIFLRDVEELRSILSRESVGSVPVKAIFLLACLIFLKRPPIR